MHTWHVRVDMHAGLRCCKIVPGMHLVGAASRAEHSRDEIAPCVAASGWDCVSSGMCAADSGL